MFFAGRIGVYERLSPYDNGGGALTTDELSITAAAYVPTDIRARWWATPSAACFEQRPPHVVDAIQASTGAGATPPRRSQPSPGLAQYAPWDAAVAYASVNRVRPQEVSAGLWRSDSGCASWSPRVSEGDIVDDRASN